MNGCVLFVFGECVSEFGVYYVRGIYLVILIMFDWNWFIIWFEWYFFIGEFFDWFCGGIVR